MCVFVSHVKYHSDCPQSHQPIDWQGAYGPRHGLGGWLLCGCGCGPFRKCAHTHNQIESDAFFDRKIDRTSSVRVYMYFYAAHVTHTCAVCVTCALCVRCIAWSSQFESSIKTTMHVACYIQCTAYIYIHIYINTHSTTYR